MLHIAATSFTEGRDNTQALGAWHSLNMCTAFVDFVGWVKQSATHQDMEQEKAR